MSSGIDFTALREANPIPAIASGLKGFHRAGHEYKACCPFHSEKTPSFTIFAGGQKFHCFGCGAHGDVVDYVRLIDGVDCREAAERLDAGLVPKVPVQELPPAKEKQSHAAALSIWKQAVKASGTPVEAYLRGRGITMPIPLSIRFSRLSNATTTSLLPCMVALVVDVDGNPTGIQRTYLQEDGSGKADIPKPKLCLGRISGGATRIGEPSTELVITGGLEDALTLHQVLGKPAWGVTGEAMMARLQLPDIVQSITIGADNDASGEAAAQKAATAFAKTGRAVRIIRPKKNKDWNAELMARLERSAA